jgi:hypothetical protein
MKIWHSSYILDSLADRETKNSDIKKARNQGRENGLKKNRCKADDFAFRQRSKTDEIFHVDSDGAGRELSEKTLLQEWLV